jgi:histidinol-phosphate aminotransferase
VPEFSSIIQSLPALIPFMAPEALERSLGRPMHLRLGANESNFGISPHAAEAMKKAIERVGWYCDPENFELREALAQTHGVTRDNILVSAGLDDVLSLIARAFLNPGDYVVNSLGGYPTFNYGVQGAGGKIEFVPYRDDHVDLDGLAEAAHRISAKLAFVANPDNPSGAWHPAEKLQGLSNDLPKGCVLLLDEAYYDFAPKDAIPPIDQENRCTIRLRTFSKAHGLAGARVGYAIAHEDTIGAINKIRMHFGVNLVAQAGALASLRDPYFVSQVVDQVSQGRKDYYAMAENLGLKSIPSATNFVTIDMGSFERAKNTLSSLLQNGVFIRMPGAAPLNRCIRVTVGTPAERTRLAEEFARVVNITYDNPQG